MVVLDQVQSTIAHASKSLPPGLVAVFAGATSGIGSTALLAFAKHISRPKIYFIGRSEDAAADLIEQMKALNPDGDYIFLKNDLSLLKNVDEVCKDIMVKEKAINLLVMSPGGLIMGETKEKLPYITALAFYSRMRMLSNLLPLLRRAERLRRVITIFAGTFEGKLYTEDISGRKTPFQDARGHLTSAMTLALEGYARQAPEVSFIHSYPGAVDTNLIRAESGWYMQPMKWWVRFKFRNQWMNYEECGKRHCFLCVSPIYPARNEEAVSLTHYDSRGAVEGADGKIGSGVYTVDADGESGREKVLEILQSHRDQGYVDLVRSHLEHEFERVTGSRAMEV